MDGTIVKVVIGAVIIAAIATLIALAATYWYYVAGVGVAGYVIYYFRQKAKQRANRV